MRLIRVAEVVWRLEEELKPEFAISGIGFVQTFVPPQVFIVSDGGSYDSNE